MKREYPKELLDLLKKVEGKRSRVIVDHILKHGRITTEELEKYGYKHPPRAARDVREQGVPLKTITVTSSDGKAIAAYEFGDVSEIKKGRIGGRKVMPKKLKEELIAASGSKCFVCGSLLDSGELQVDHSVPYEVAGDKKASLWDPSDFMLLCGSCQRAKSWICEHCENWNHTQDVDTCKKCYWASPDSYTHIAGQDIRRLDVTWSGEEVEEYETLREAAESAKTSMPDFVKEALRRCIKPDKVSN